jgi:small subunit ribosomal protein S7
MDQLPHVTEEQAAIDKVTGETPPDVDQGTPVQEIFQRDKDAQDKAPEVLKQQMNSKKSTTPSGSRSFSTSARSRLEAEMTPAAADVPADIVQFQDTRAVGLEYPDAGFGHKFSLPDLSKFAKTHNFKKRYDPVVDQVTKSLMRDGKLSRAQANMDSILNTLRTAPSPGSDAAAGDRALLTDLPREALPLSPVQYLTSIIDSVAPLVKIRQQRGILGGGAAMPVPLPLNKRQRRRTAIQWILTAAESRREQNLADRVAKELLNVAEGKGSAWERRQRVHKLAISARANIKAALGGPGMRRR